MNMPGFSGEASLYKTSRHYYEAGNLTQTYGVYPRSPYFINRRPSLISRSPLVFSRSFAVHHANPIAFASAGVQVAPATLIILSALKAADLFVRKNATPLGVVISRFKRSRCALLRNPES